MYGRANCALDIWTGKKSSWKILSIFLFICKDSININGKYVKTHEKHCSYMHGITLSVMTGWWTFQKLSFQVLCM